MSTENPQQTDFTERVSPQGETLLGSWRARGARVRLRTAGPAVRRLHAVEPGGVTPGEVTPGVPSRRHGPALLGRLLLGSDVVALAGSVAIVTAVGAMPLRAGTLGVAIVLVIVLLSGTGLAAAYGLYSRDEQRVDHTSTDDIPPLFHVTVITTCLAAMSLWLAGHQVTVGAMLGLYVLAFTMVIVGRVTIRALYRRGDGHRQSTIIVGAGSVGQLLAAKLSRRPVHGLDVVGFVDDGPPELSAPVAHVPVLGKVDELPRLIRHAGVERVLVAFSRHSHEQTVTLLRSLKDVDVQVDVVPRLFDAFGPNAEIHAIDGMPLIGRPRACRSRGALFLKRAFDLSVSLVGLVALAPLFGLIVLLVKLVDRGPAIYRAERIGRGGRTFLQLKFRTMKVPFCRGLGYGGAEADAAFERLLDEDPSLRAQFEATYKLDPDPRVTRIGRILRTSSLDELPQLLNVIRGDMSLVGPRPVTAAELERYGEDIDALLSVRPGLTGYWQVNGRSALAYQERVRLDLAYVASWSLSLDLRILLKTFNAFSDRVGAV